MGAPSFLAGETLSASDLKLQTNHICTSGTRPASPWEGLRIRETDTDKNYEYSGSAWVQVLDSEAWDTFTPTLTGSGGNPNLGSGSSVAARYTREGRTIKGWVAITFGTSGTSAGTGTYTVAAPATGTSGINNLVPVGFALLLDSSAGATNHPLVLLNGAGTGFIFSYPLTWPSGTATSVGAAAPWAWAASDSIRFSFQYEAAAST